MAAKREWDTKFAYAKRRVQKQRAREMAKGYHQFGDGEVPPPSALAGRRIHGDDLKEGKKNRSVGMSLWSLWGSKHDERAIEKEEEADRADREPGVSVATAGDGQNARPLGDTKTSQGNLMDQGKRPDYSRSRSRRRTVTDEHQTEGSDDIDENTTAADLLAIKRAKGEAAPPGDGSLTPDFMSAKGKEAMPSDDTAAAAGTPSRLIHKPTADETDLRRPKAAGIAFPFSLRQHKGTASMTTLTSAIDVQPVEDVSTKESKESGVEQNATDMAATNAMGSSNGQCKDSKNNWGTLGGIADTAKEGRKMLGALRLSNVTNGAESVVENGEVISADGPPLETFQTAE